MILEQLSSKKAIAAIAYFKAPYNSALSSPHINRLVGILNQQGRRKAQFLVNAVMHYLHWSETPVIPQAAQINTDAIEIIVRHILQEKSTSAPALQDTPKTKWERHDENMQYEDDADIIVEDGLAAIQNTMAALRK